MKPFLRVKIKSLATEARIIRLEEIKYKPRIKRIIPSDDNVVRYEEDNTYFELHNHRTFVVRGEARSALLAYGVLRGRTYKQMEAKCYQAPDWVAVRNNLVRFGGYAGFTKENTDVALKAWADSDSLKEQAA